MERMDRIEKGLEFLAQSVAKNDVQIGQLSQLVSHFTEGMSEQKMAVEGIIKVISGLTEIVKSHESRLNRMEGK